MSPALVEMQEVVRGFLNEKDALIKAAQERGDNASARYHIDSMRRIRTELDVVESLADEFATFDEAKFDILGRCLINRLISKVLEESGRPLMLA